LYDPRFEHDACGVGFVVNIKGERSHGIVEKGLEILRNLEHPPQYWSKNSVEPFTGPSSASETPHSSVAAMKARSAPPCERCGRDEGSFTAPTIPNRRNATHAKRDITACRRIDQLVTANFPATTAAINRTRGPLASIDFRLMHLSYARAFASSAGAARCQ
jgi:hypothetical protein